MVNKLLHFTIIGLFISGLWSVSDTRAETAKSAAQGTHQAAETVNKDKNKSSAGSASTTQHATTKDDKSDKEDAASAKEEEQSSDTEEEDVPTTEEDEEPSIVDGFTLKHRVNEGTPLPEETISGIDPMVLLQTFKKDILAQLDKYGKPLKVETEISIDFAENVADSITELPPLVAKTAIDASGKGKTEFSQVAFKGSATLDPEAVEATATENKKGENAVEGEKDEKGSKPDKSAEKDQAKPLEKTTTQPKETLHWESKGLTGDLAFPAKLDTIVANLKLEGLTLKGDKDPFTMTIEKTTLKSELDADLIPTKVDFGLPAITLNTQDGQISLKETALNLKVDKAPNGVQLNTVVGKIGQASLTQGEMKLTLNDFQIQGGSGLKNDMVNYGLQAKIAQLLLPKEVIGEALDLKYVSNLELRNVDAEAVIDLQKTARELQKQHRENAVSEEMLNFALLGKLMELSPKLLVRSPELALTELTLSTKEGDIKGTALLTIDGKKPGALQDVKALVSALKAKAELVVPKEVLSKILSVQVREQLAKGGDPSKVDEKQLHTGISQKIDELVGKKVFIAAENNTYQLSATLADGKLLVNGVETPFSIPSPAAPPDAEEDNGGAEEIELNEDGEPVQEPPPTKTSPK